ncbi:MAG: DUF4175 family protein [Alphaproteobacteria bacterium]|jgi:uncharacterized protein (TIGR02302 family)|nr:DUF4175 family protein [Alphaproteobacteria bacterium]
MPIALTLAGLWAERVTRAFWPVWTVLFVGLAPLIMGWQDSLPLEVVWGFAVVVVLALGWAFWHGVRGFRTPSRDEALARVDARLPGRPIAALEDQQAIGAGDAASETVWRVHLQRMSDRTRDARPVEPDLRLSRADPFGLRYIALLVLVVALMFGSLLRVGSVVEAGVGGTGQIATGPVWEGWVEPPGYTGKPTLYLADLQGQAIRAPEGALITVRLYGEVGELTVAETVSGRAGEVPPASDVQQSFEVAQSGRLEILGEGGATWDVVMVPDEAPMVELAGPVEVEASGEMAQPFRASDDHGVFAGEARIELDLAAVDRRHGLAVDPDPREALIVDLPMPFSGDRAEFEESLIDDFSQHPWANLPVTLTLTVEDAVGQSGSSPAETVPLPGRRFFQPVAKAVIEQRRDLLWSKANAPRVAMVLRAVSHRPDELFNNETSYLRLRVTLRRLEAEMEDGLSDTAQQEIAQALWDLAILLEDGSLADARERLERAQDRLAEAMRNGASDEEIQELMDELRAAMDEYMRMLAENAEPGEDGTDQPDSGQENRQVSQSEIDALMDRIQELMEEGRMAEAQELMEQLNQMMENMRVTRGEGGDGPRTPGEQSMQDLAETLRDQQQLNDDAFRELQEQFNQGQQQGQQGQQQGQQGQQQGQQGQQQGQQGQQQGQQPGGEDQPGQGQQQGQQGQGLGQGDNSQQGMTGEGGQGGEATGEGSLADRQNALRQGLNQLRNALPGLDGEAADRAGEALGRAEDAMEGAEDALRDGEMAEAIDRQSEAMDALRDGMRNLGEALAENQSEDLQEGQGTQTGRADGRPEPGRRDPLGRQMGNSGQFGSDENMLQDEDVYRRAEELLKELRDRSADQERPDLELDYLKRLLERF